MATLLIDTHNFINRLKTAGFQEEQAKAIVEGLKDASLDSVATKDDVRLAIAELKADVFKWLIPILLGQIAVFTAVVKFVMEL